MDTIKRIVVTGDLLRIEHNNNKKANNFIRFVYELLKEQIYLATGIYPEVALAGDSPGFDRNTFYALSGFDKPSFENWLQIASGKCRQDAGDYLLKCFSETLIISYEAGAFEHGLKQTRLPYIDIRISPIRFLEDLFLAFKSNIPEVQSKLWVYHIPDSYIRLSVNILKSYYLIHLPESCIARAASTANLPRNTLLICGQTDVDLSLVRHGQIVSFHDFANELHQLINEHHTIYYKAHPNASLSSPNLRFIRSIKKIKITKNNIYRMLCDDNLKTVTALSSGVLHEAPWFGKKIQPLSHRFVELANETDKSTAGSYIMIHNEYFSPTFWSDILSPCLPTKRCEDIIFTPTENFLRKRTGKWWGYEIGADKNSITYIDSLRRIVDTLDPHRILREKIDSSGNIRNWIKRILTPVIK